MRLVFIMILTLILYILIPSLYTPALFLGILAIYILSRQYWLVVIWLIIIVFILQISTLMKWWELALYYFIWSFGVYVISIFLDKSWAVQSTLAIIWLFLAKLIMNGFVISYMDLFIYTFVNAIGIAVSLYFAEKLKLYEKFF
jgi:hypothetical protein